MSTQKFRRYFEPAAIGEREMRETITKELQVCGGFDSISSLATKVRERGFILSGPLGNFEDAVVRLGFPIERRYRKRPMSNGELCRIGCFVHLPAPMEAVRALRRAWAPHAESFELGARADAGFDGGEWSGPAHAKAEQLAFNMVVSAVAVRFHIAAPALLSTFERAEHEKSHRGMRARLSHSSGLAVQS